MLMSLLSFFLILVHFRPLLHLTQKPDIWFTHQVKWPFSITGSTRLKLDNSNHSDIFYVLKPDSHLPKTWSDFVCFHDIPLKMMKNAFYFIFSSFSLLRYLDFCWRFLHRISSMIFFKKYWSCCILLTDQNLNIGRNLNIVELL